MYSKISSIFSLRELPRTLQCHSNNWYCVILFREEFQHIAVRTFIVLFHNHKIITTNIFCHPRTSRHRYTKNSNTPFLPGNIFFVRGASLWCTPITWSVEVVPLYIKTCRCLFPHLLLTTLNTQSIKLYDICTIAQYNQKWLRTFYIRVWRHTFNWYQRPNLAAQESMTTLNITHVYKATSCKQFLEDFS